MRGKFITFDGVDGCGKTSQMRRLSARLDALGVDHLLTRQPGGTSVGLGIRTLLLESRTPDLFPETELLLYAADRAQHVREVILPALDAGRVVLCDRYTDATVAFQGYGRGRSLDLVDTLNRTATGGLMPELTVVIDLDVREAEARMRDKPSEFASGAADRLDTEEIAFHERVREAYLTIARAEPERVRIVDGAGSFDEVAARIDVVVLSFLCLSPT